MTQEDKYLKRAEDLLEKIRYREKYSDIWVENYLAIGIAAALREEREKVAKWIIDHEYATGHGDTTEEMLEYLVKQEREKVIEECAKVADKIEKEYRNDAWALGIPEALRKLKGRE